MDTARETLDGSGLEDLTGNQKESVNQFQGLFSSEDAAESSSAPATRALEAAWFDWVRLDSE